MKNYHHGNLKKELIEAACFLCERDGYTKLSIRSLAKESNVSQTAPYRHFKTKECVYAAVAEEGFKKLGKVTYFDPSKKISKKNLIESCEKYIAFGLRNAHTYDLMFGTAVGKFSMYPKLLEAANSSYANLVTNISRLTGDDTETVSAKCITIWSIIHGLVGILRKAEMVGDDLDTSQLGPISVAQDVSKNLMPYLDKVMSGIIEN
jgi:AcrR family transcriptional regulator